MPWTSANLTATELTRLAADLPILGYRNALQTSIADPIWNVSGDGVDPDTTEPFFPGARAYDDAGYLLTRPQEETGPITHCLIFQLSAATFDHAAILGHNFDLLPQSGVSFEIRLEIANDLSFTSNNQIIYRWTTGLTRRLASFGLDHATGTFQRYSAVDFARIVIVYNATSPAPPPQLAEIFLGIRTALPNRPETPVDESQLESQIDVLETDFGPERLTSIYTGRLAFGPRWRPDSTVYADQFRTWFAGTSYGLHPFLWAPAPSSSAASCYFARTEPALSVVPISGTEQEVTIPIVEQLPFVSKEG